MMMMMRRRRRRLITQGPTHLDKNAKPAYTLRVDTGTHTMRNAVLGQMRQAIQLKRGRTGGQARGETVGRSHAVEV